MVIAIMSNLYEFGYMFKSKRLFFFYCLSGVFLIMGLVLMLIGIFDAAMPAQNSNKNMMFALIIILIGAVITATGLTVLKYALSSFYVNMNSQSETQRIDLVLRNRGASESDVISTVTDSWSNLHFEHPPPYSPEPQLNHQKLQEGRY